MGEGSETAVIKENKRSSDLIGEKVFSTIRIVKQWSRLPKDLV